MPAAIASHPPQTAIVGLWLERIFAAFAGSTVFCLGVLGILAYVHKGPLAIFIPPERLGGDVVNVANIAAAIAAVTAVLGAVASRVITGVARAYLRRQTIRGSAPRIGHWRTLAAGVSVWASIRTPTIAYGLLLSFALTAAIQGSSLVGVAVPTNRQLETNSTAGPFVPYRGNNGSRVMAQCSLADGTVCAQSLALHEIASALSTGISHRSGAFYPLSSGGSLFARSGFPAGLIIAPPSIAYKNFTWTTLMAVFETECAVIPRSGVDGNAFYFESTCGDRLTYGVAGSSLETYIAIDGCQAVDGYGVVLNIAIGGGLVENIDTNTYAVTCKTAAKEGTGNGFWTFEAGGQAFLDSTLTGNAVNLYASEVQSIATAIVAAVGMDVRADGGYSKLKQRLASSVLPGGLVDVTSIANGLSNAYAASATAGYTFFSGLPLSDSFYADLSGVIQEMNTTTTVSGYGWAPSARLLGWSTSCIAIGLVWMALAIYMHGGGTRYDPSDWYQTVNTTAGSRLVQKAGTCTGAHLGGRTIKERRLFYGELQPNHIGFSYDPVPAIVPTGVYGDSTMRAQGR